MHFLTEIARGVVVNPLPINTQQDEDLLRKYHLIPKRNPWRSRADLISYIFTSLMVWKKVFCEFLSCLDKFVIALVSKERKQSKNEAKSGAYFFWESLCLPIVLFAGFFFKEVRNAFSFAPFPVTEDYARREAIGLKEEVKEYVKVIKEKEKIILGLETKVEVLQVSLSEEIATTEGLSRPPSSEELLEAINNATELLKKDHELKLASLEKKLKLSTAQVESLSSKEAELRVENEQINEKFSSLKASQVNRRQVTVGQYELLENIKRQRAHCKTVELTKGQLDRLLD